MLKFKPISYNEGDFRTVKLSGASSDIQEGYICYVAAAEQDKVIATLYTGQVYPTVSYGGSINVTSGSILALVQDTAKYFPIYREDPDPENVSATLSANQYCIAYTGKEWEVHVDSTEYAAVASFTTVGGKCCVGTSGKWAYKGQHSCTPYVIAECIGTFGDWVRMRRL